MIDYGTVHGSTRPEPMKITPKAVFIASNIEPYEKELDEHIISGYQYNLVEYTKDEYIAKLNTDLLDTQVALCDIYELIAGGMT